MIVVFDLDDTLYDEVEFVKSGFRELANYLKCNEYYDFMIEEFSKNGSGKIFNNLIEEFNLEIDLKKLIEVYRFHRPTIDLPIESISLLEYAQKFQTALISDGHYIMQQNKFSALGLDKYIKLPIFTDFYHTKKPELEPYTLVMNHFIDEKDFIYISDNPKKDFIATNKLDWTSIRLKNHNGIYKDYESNATYEVENRLDIIKILEEMS